MHRPSDNGPLYNVTRASDGKSALVGVLAPGGYANIATHEAFCAKLDCVISNVMDQSPMNAGSICQPTMMLPLTVSVGGGPAASRN